MKERKQKKKHRLGPLNKMSEEMLQFSSVLPCQKKGIFNFLYTAWYSWIFPCLILFSCTPSVLCKDVTESASFQKHVSEP